MEQRERNLNPALSQPLYCIAIVVVHIHTRGFAFANEKAEVQMAEPSIHV
jgi:hypothetical protein